MADFDLFGLGNGFKAYDFTDKDYARKSYIYYMLNRVMSMFKYEGLPDTIPQKYLELYMMVNGHAVIVKHEGELYVCFGGWGGEPDAYYVPRNYIVANPYLKLFKTYTIGEDCVLVHNDSLYYGLMPMFRRYASQLVENDITMRMVDINSRIVALIDAPDDASRASAEKYLMDIEAGRNGVCGSNAFWDGITTQPYGEHNYQRLTDLIEYQQYTKASWFNELGLNSNYNMKREAITSNESQLNDDMLLPLIDDMMNCRKKWIEEVNAMFGTEISIDWASSWKDNQIETELAQESMVAEIGSIHDNSDSDSGDNFSETDDESESDIADNGDIDDNNSNSVGSDSSDIDIDVVIEVNTDSERSEQGGDEDVESVADRDSDETVISSDASGERDND